MAAAMWIMPHLIAMDEPTNYLDNETLAVLTQSLKNFRGGAPASLTFRLASHAAAAAAAAAAKPPPTAQQACVLDPRL